ncbi:unnamed protein product, partial [Prorocentrum cordatum]
GPMTVPEIVAKHMEGAKHKRKWEHKKGLGVSEDGHLPELPDEYTVQCIIQGDGLNGLKAGEFRCTLCNAGPFNALATVDVHIKSKKHTKAMTPAEPQEQAEEAAKKDPFEGKVWNLPDYVRVTSDTLECTLCPAKANAYLNIAMHLGGDKHAKKCRGSGNHEIIWNQARQLLEVMVTGEPVVRTGHRRPKKASADATKKVEAAVPADPGPLPEGWQEFTDTSSGHVYYYHAGQKVSQWERPAAPAQDCPPQQAQVAEQHEEAAQDAAAGEREPEAAAEPDPEAELPPGWHAVWCEESGALLGRRGDPA